jgi:predicted metal-dependent enzyme (double-stranded beta helix superfamily)
MGALMTGRLQQFLDACRAAAGDQRSAAEAVEATVPLMLALLPEAGALLGAAHRRSDAGHYTRNAVLIEPQLSLYAIVWRPGQWTPVHDHGSWGVVGVVEGVLYERAWLRTDPGAADPACHRGIRLAPGGTLALTPGAVSSFVPNPDHIHVTGVPADAAPALTLHLYGRNMESFHLYDMVAGTRQRVSVPHNES